VGYQTDFVGYLQIEPPLGARERSFINRISGSLFLQETGGSLRVPHEDDEVLRELMHGAPRGWSNWTVCRQGVSTRAGLAMFAMRHGLAATP